jgi:hypothetical protein
LESERRRPPQKEKLDRETKDEEKGKKEKKRKTG